MLDFRIAVRMTVLLVDDDPVHVDTCALTLEMNGFSVVSATSPYEAISIMNENTQRKIDVAILDYHMPLMNECILADYLKARYPELKIVLYSGSLDIREQEMSSINLFVPKGDGIAVLLAKIADSGPTDVANPTYFAAENTHCIGGVN